MYIIPANSAKAINAALSYPDVAWAYHRIMSAADKLDMDQLLVRVGHPLAMQSGTNEHRFRTLHREAFQFAEN
jgi:hypothetical protein